jgi:hypothetical protein
MTVRQACSLAIEALERERDRLRLEQRELERLGTHNSLLSAKKAGKRLRELDQALRVMEVLCWEENRSDLSAGELL